ncbi:MAG: DUF2442 domain-containing protein [Acetobacteraceae bacterium]|nr:DUF2442 domain-containing protein [Acetobacteraceae bacterium]
MSVSGETLTVGLRDGRAISVPVAWYPRLANASQAQRSHWRPCGAGYGIHWPDIDEDISVDGLLRGARALQSSRLAKVP